MHRVTKVAQRVKMPATKTDNPSSTPGVLMVKGENQIISVVLGPLHSCVLTDKCNPKFTDACFCGAGDPRLMAVGEQCTVKPPPNFSVHDFFLVSRSGQP